jgi:hypothetical protein
MQGKNMRRWKKGNEFVWESGEIFFAKKFHRFPIQTHLRGLTVNWPVMRFAGVCNGLFFLFFYLSAILCPTTITAQMVWSNWENSGKPLQVSFSSRLRLLHHDLINPVLISSGGHFAPNRQPSEKIFLSNFKYPLPVGDGRYLWTAEVLPFFCRIEHHLDKKMRTPFKFRLGSVEYVDWLEGKPGCTSFGP